MEYAKGLENLKLLTKQRNIVFGIAGIMFVANLMLISVMVMMRREIVMVPGIEQEFRIAGGKVSASYLEERALEVLSHLLDLTPETVMLKKEYILRHTAASGIKKIGHYFAEAQKQHQAFKFSTFFTPKGLEIDVGSKEVIARGILTSRFGKEGHKDEEVEYRLKFEMKKGRPLLLNFKKVEKAAETGK